jgi:predicted MFS family arabinose efflux permease
MRRLVALVATIILVDTVFYAALAPMLPALRDDLGLSKGDTGVLVAVYAIGTLLGALPAGVLVARVGARRVLVGGLTVATAAGLLFAFADAFGPLLVARFVQGVGGACSWTAGFAFLAQNSPPARRGAAIGTAMGAGIFGAQLGPVLGAGAEAVGRDVAFTAMAGVGLVLAGLALTLPRRGRPEAPREATLGTALRDGPFRAALWVTLLPALSFGVVEVLAPLDLDELGADANGIAAIFFVSALVEGVISPLTGRWADRHGVRGLLRVGLLGSAVGLAVLAFPRDLAVLAVLLVAASGALGMLWTPGGNLASLRADALGLDQGLAFAANNVGWAGGAGAGAALAGVLGELVGDAAAYGLVAALCLGTAVAWWAGPPGGARPAETGPATNWS